MKYTGAAKKIVDIIDKCLVECRENDCDCVKNADKVIQALMKPKGVSRKRIPVYEVGDLVMVNKGKNTTIMGKVESVVWSGKPIRTIKLVVVF